MKKASSSDIKRGQSISFRVPSDTSDYLLKQLQQLKETEKRNFSSKIAEFVLDGLGKVHVKERETITIPLPKSLNKSQKNWLKHEHSEALLGGIIYQLITDPVRATALLASLNSNAVDIDDALYLQENDLDKSYLQGQAVDAYEETAAAPEYIDQDDGMAEFDWESAKQQLDESASGSENEEEKNDLDDLLGGFLAHMNR